MRSHALRPIGNGSPVMSHIDTESSIRRNPDLLSVEMDGDLVMMSIESGNYFGVSGIGPFIWDLIENYIKFDELVVAVCGEFEVDRGTAIVDLQSFLAQLSEQGIIEVS